MLSSVQRYYILTILIVISYITLLCRISVTENFHVEDPELYNLFHLVFSVKTTAVIKVSISRLYVHGHLFHYQPVQHLQDIC
jgi:hypothetical protein